MHSISLSQVYESIEAIQPLVSDLVKNKSEIEKKVDTLRYQIESIKALETVEKSSLESRLSLLDQELFSLGLEAICKKTDLFPHEFFKWQSNLDLLEELEEISFREVLISHLPPTELERIDQLAQEKLSEIDKLVETIHLCDWYQQPIFLHPNPDIFANLALAAVRAHKMKVIDFSAIMTYWTILRYHPISSIRKHQIFLKDGSMNPDFLRDFTYTLNFQFENAKTHLKSHLLTDKQIFDFGEEIKKLKPLHHQIWIVDDLFFHHVQLAPNFMENVHQFVNKKFSIVQIIQKKIGINILNQLEDSNQRMIPFLSHMQAFLNQRHVNPVKLQSMLGEATIQDLYRNGLENTRIVSIPFPIDGFKDFDRADGLTVAHDYNMAYHDGIYHANTVSMIPVDHRLGFILFAESIQCTLSQEPFLQNAPLQAIGKRFYNRFIDMEFDFYTYISDFEQDNEPFVLSITRAEETAISRIYLHEVIAKRNELARDLKKEEIKEILQKITTEKILPQRAAIAKKEFRLAVCKKFIQSLLKKMTENPDLSSLIENLDGVIGLDDERTASKLKNPLDNSAIRDYCAKQSLEPSWPRVLKQAALSLTLD
jgi:hypothetical protein